MSALTVAQVAARLAVSQKSVYRLVRSGALPATRVGRAIRIDEGDLAVLRVHPEHEVGEHDSAPRRRVVPVPRARTSGRWRVK